MLLKQFLAIPLLFFPLILANPMPTPAPEPHSLEKRACSADNCLRAFQRFILSAVPYCETRTAAPTPTIPAWADNCQGNPTRVASACGCLQTGTLNKVYGPVDNTNYTIFEQAYNIRSLPGPSPDEFFQDCYNTCNLSGARCQTFSFAQMSKRWDGGDPGGLYLCYQYTTLFQPERLQSVANWTGNVVYQRG